MSAITRVPRHALKLHYFLGHAQILAYSQTATQGVAMGELLNLGTWLKYIPDGMALAAVAVVGCLFLCNTVLQQRLLDVFGKRAREKLVLFIIRAAFIGTGVIFLASCGLAIRSGISKEANISSVVNQSGAAPPGAQQKITPIIPQQGVDDLAQYLVALSRRLSAPPGLDEALARLQASDAGPAIAILRNEILAQQAENKKRAQTMRRIALLELLRNPETALQIYLEAAELDPENWDTWAQIGFLRARRGENDAAVAAANKALEIGRQHRQRQAEAAAHAVLGTVEYNKGQFEEARRLFNQSRGEYLAAGAKVEYARMTLNLARVYYVQRDFQGSIRYYEEALASDKESNNALGFAAALNGLGEVYTRLREYDKAVTYFTQSLAISEKLQDLHYVALSRSALGNLYKNRSNPGDLDRAREAHSKALEIQRHLNNPLLVAYELANLGRIDLANKNYEEAERKHLEAIKLVKGISPFSEAVHNRGLGEIYFEWGMPASALDAYRRAFELDKDLPFKADAVLDLFWIGTVYLELNQKRETCEAWKQAQQYFASVNDAGLIADIRQAAADAHCEI